MQHPPLVWYSSMQSIPLLTTHPNSPFVIHVNPFGPSPPSHNSPISRVSIRACEFAEATSFLFLSSTSSLDGRTAPDLARSAVETVLIRAHFSLVVSSKVVWCWLCSSLISAFFASSLVDVCLFFRCILAGCCFGFQLPSVEQGSPSLVLPSSSMPGS